MSENRGDTASSTEADRKRIRRALLASAFGSSIEWFDFYVYGLSAALIFNTLFFPQSSPTSGTLLALSTFFVGFLSRPIGAAIFGHFGDRIGRRTVLVVTTLLMGGGTFLVGVVPTYATIGSWGGILLVVMRLVQGIGVGGDWGGSVLMATEWNSARGRRGLLGSLPQFGSPLGLILATVLTEASSQLLAPAAYQDWGWRIPFLFSALLTAIVLYLRLRVEETTSFTEAKQAGALRQAPILHLLRHHWRTVVLTVLMRAGQHASFYLFTTFVLTYGTTELGRSRTTMLLSVMLAAVISLGTTLLWGAISDRIGRKRMLMIGIVTMFVFALPYYGLLNAGSTALMVVGIVLSLIVHDMQYGPQSSFIAESFPADIRYSGASLGYQLSGVTSGGPAALVATALIASYASAVPVALYLMGMCLIAFLALLALPSVDDRPDKEAHEAPATVAARVDHPTV